MQNIKLYGRLKLLRYPISLIKAMVKLREAEATTRAFLRRAEDRGLLEHTGKYWFPTKLLMENWDDID